MATTEKGQQVRNRSAANSGRVPFAPAYVPELYDSRLSSDEKVLLWKVRYRAGVKGATWISWETMAEESGKSRATLMRQVKKLRDLGFLATEARGFGKTTDKVIECPTEIYPQDLCDSHTVGRYFRKDRNEGVLDELMSKTIISLTGETTDDDSDGQGGALTTPVVSPVIPHESHQRDPISLTSETPLVSPVRLELDKSKLDKSKLDPSPSGQRGDQQAGSPVVDGDGGLNEDLEPETPFANSSKNSVEGESDPRLAKARELQAVTSRQTLDTAREKHAARKAGQAERAASGLTREHQEYMRQLAEENHKPSHRMFLFFKPVFLDYFPKDPFPIWGKREHSQANNLLEKYDGDLELICEAWVYTCREWDVVKKKTRLTEDYPSAGVLLALHARIFPMLGKSKTKREDVEGKGGQLDSQFEW